jgi:hypothetical protein
MLMRYWKEDPVKVTSIELLQDSLEHTVNINAIDIVIVTLGSTNARLSLGNNRSSPPNLSLSCATNIMCSYAPRPCHLRMRRR